MSRHLRAGPAAGCLMLAATLGVSGPCAAESAGQSAAVAAPLPARDPAPPSPRAQTAAYAGSAACRSCHEDIWTQWSASLHAAAMHEPAPPVPDDAGLRGSQASAAQNAPASSGEAAPHQQRATFGKDGAGRIQFSTDGRMATITEPGAATARVEVPYVFGARPMRQPLAGGERGRLQALPVAWDTDAREWFDVFGGQDRRPGDFGHFLGRGM